VFFFSYDTRYVWRIVNGWMLWYRCRVLTAAAVPMSCHNFRCRWPKILFPIFVRLRWRVNCLLKRAVFMSWRGDAAWFWGASNQRTAIARCCTLFQSQRYWTYPARHVRFLGGQTSRSSPPTSSYLAQSQRDLPNVDQHAD